MKNYYLHHLSENNIDMIFNLFDKKLKSDLIDKNLLFLNKNFKYNEISKISLRQGLYNYFDEYIGYIDINDNILSIISMSLLFDRAETLYINFIYFENNNIINEFFSEVLKYIETDLSNITIKTFRKIRVSLNTISTSYEYWKDFFINVGFIIESTKEKEEEETFIYILK